MHKQEVIKHLEEALQTVKYGCLDHNCALNEDNHGQHTNGGCTCRFNLRKKLMRLLNRLDTEGIEKIDSPTETPYNDWF